LTLARDAQKEFLIGQSSRSHATYLLTISGWLLFVLVSSSSVCDGRCVDNLLPVTLAGGINILESGQMWLEKHLTDHRVWFKPLRITNDDRLECIVHTRMVSLSVSVSLCVCACAGEVMFLQLVCLYILWF